MANKENKITAATKPIKRHLHVYVVNMRDQPLMPCSPRKARLLLEQGKAYVVKRTPFTIQLNYVTGEARQQIQLGMDSGYLTIGISAVTKKWEVFAAEVQLRKDLVKLNSERQQYRRSRRSRKTWYRKPRFLNRRKPEGWLPPSLQHKLISHLKIIEFINKLLPISINNIEVAAFDIQKIKNPDVAGVEYQEGEQKGFWNIREYVLYRDGHICQHCKGKSKDPVLEVHHLVSRQIGGDRPENQITLCKTCHQKVTHRKIELKMRPKKGFKAETFMNTIRWKLVDKLQDKGKQVSHTYGYITKSKRISLGLKKSHINDAFVIAGGKTQQRSMYFRIKQVRKCNRKLYRGTRSHIRNTASRYLNGFQRYDKVMWNGKTVKERGIECFIWGRRTSGYFSLKKLNGTTIHNSAPYRQLKLLESAKTYLIERI